MYLSSDVAGDISGTHIVIDSGRSGTSSAQQQPSPVASAPPAASRFTAPLMTAPQILRTMENLRLALRMRLERGPLASEQINDVAAAIDAAATAAERV